MTTDSVVDSVQEEQDLSQELLSQEVASSQSEEPTSEVVSNEAERPTLSDDQKVGLLEALLLASGDPLPISRVEEVTGCSKGEVLQLAEALKQAYVEDKRGLELVCISQKLQLRTKAIYAEYVRQLIAIKPRKLSQAALETLSVIAYQQPVVKSEVDKIRGVDVAPTIKTLLERKLVKILGYQASVGQPALYGTTDDFLSVFGLESLAGLPSLRDLKALAKEPGEATDGDDNAQGSENESLEDVDTTMDAAIENEEQHSSVQ